MFICQRADDADDVIFYILLQQQHHHHLRFYVKISILEIVFIRLYKYQKYNAFRRLPVALCRGGFAFYK